jgi:hypothetical protein
LRLALLALSPLYAAGFVSLMSDYETAHFGALGFALYAAALLSFLGGVRCGMEIARAPDQPDALRLAFSALPALAGWALSLFVAATPAAAGAASAFAGLFAAQYLWDYRSAEDAGAPAWYPLLRQVMTGGVMIACLLLPLANLLRRI